MTDRNRGAIIFIAIWTLVILSILAIGISGRASSEIRFAKYLDRQLSSLLLAKAALNLAILELEKDKTSGYDTLYELNQYTQEEGVFERGSFICNFFDEAGLININTASASLINKLPGLSDRLAKKIFNSELKPFSIKEEILLINGITPQIYLGLKDFITVYGDGRVNINTASSEVFNILGMDSDLIDKILGYRKGQDAQEATEDDREFKNIFSIIGDLREITILSLEQELKIAELLSRNLICVNTSNIRLNMETEILGNPVKNYTVVLERPTGKIRFWQER